MAPKKGISEAQCHKPPPGLTTINTPNNPTITAIQRLIPTLSLRIGMDNMVMNSGAVKPMAVASAIGKYVRPKNRNVIEAAKNAGRSN